MMRRREPSLASASADLLDSSVGGSGGSWSSSREGSPEPRSPPSSGGDATPPGLARASSSWSFASSSSAFAPPPPPSPKPAALLRCQSAVTPRPLPRPAKAQARSRSWNPPPTAPPPPPPPRSEDLDSEKSKRGPTKNTANGADAAGGGYAPTPLAVVLGAVSLAALILLSFRAVVLYQDYRNHRHNHHHHRHNHSLHHHFHHHHTRGGEEDAILDYDPLPFRVDDLDEVAQRSPDGGGGDKASEKKQARGVVFSAWIFLDEAEDDDSSDDYHDSEDEEEEHEKHDWEEMGARVVFSTGGLDPSGECDARSSSSSYRSPGNGGATAREAGMALYVNPPAAGQLSDRLMLAYRSSDSSGSSGCKKLVSTGRYAEVEEEEWVQVALEITPQEDGEEMIRLYVDGREVAHLAESDRIKPSSGGKTALSGTASGTLVLGGDVGMLGVWSTTPDSDSSSDAERDHEHWDPDDLIDELFDAEFELDEVRETFPEGRVALLELDADVEEDSDDAEDHDHMQNPSDDGGEDASMWRRSMVAGRGSFSGDL